MTPQEIHSRLQARFGDAVTDWQEPEIGDPVIRVASPALHDVCRFLADAPDLHFDFLRIISGIDYGDKLGAAYHLYSYRHEHAIVLRVEVERERPQAPSIVDIWPAAEWHEREAYDMVGLLFEGHKDLRRMLLPDDWEGFPLRKDYETPKEYNGLTNE